MTQPSSLTESENAILRLVAAFVQLPNSRLKLSAKEHEDLKNAQTKLNQNW